VLTVAISKINSEIAQSKNNPYVQAIGGYLLDYLQSHPEAAEKINADDKTVFKSLDAMKKEAEKKKVGNCAVLTDSEGFAIVLKYFGIEGQVEKFDSAVIITAQPKKPEVDFSVSLDDLLEE